MREPHVSGDEQSESSIETIDRVLEVEDPGFVAELKQLKESVVIPETEVVLDADLDQIVQNEKIEQASKGRKRLRLLFVVRPWRKLVRALSTVKAIGPWMKLTALPSLKARAGAVLRAVKAAFAWLGHRFKTGLSLFSKQSKQAKLMMVVVAVLAIGAGFMTRIAFHGPFLPTLEKDFVYSFAPIADKSYAYEASEKWQDLKDPLLHPEHIVLLERLIVNLHTPGDGSNPMALLDLYIETSSQEAAVEIKDRDAAVRDLVLRTMEQLSYDELVTDTGKNKLKVFLRKNLNDMMSRGRIRRIFFKSIVLKP